MHVAFVCDGGCFGCQNVLALPKSCFAPEVGIAPAGLNHSSSCCGLVICKKLSPIRHRELLGGQHQRVKTNLQPLVTSIVQYMCCGSTLDGTEDIVTVVLRARRDNVFLPATTRGVERGCLSLALSLYALGAKHLEATGNSEAILLLHL